MIMSATSKGKLASVFFEQSSQISSNFGDSEDSMDSPTSMYFNALMADLTNMDEKFVMMEQTIEALKKFVDDKNLHIDQLKNKLEAFKPGESSHIPTYPSGFDQRTKGETICFSCCTICQTVARHDDEHYQGSIWRKTTKLLVVIQAIH